jgi:hypothetical protein
MTNAQRRVTTCFGLGIGAVMAWGLGTYAWLFYQDATAPPGSLSEGAFLEGRLKLVLAALLSVLLAMVWAACHFRLGGSTK